MKQESVDPIKQKPVAYDTNGQPLYAAPQPAVATKPQGMPAPTSNVTIAPESIEGQNFDPKQRVQYSDASYTVHSTRAFEPKVSEVSDELRARHEASMHDYPELNLSEGEYVILSVRRHPIGMLAQIAVTIIVIAILGAALVLYPTLFVDQNTGVVANYGIVATVILGLITLVAIAGYIAVWVYRRNFLYLTNESVIQEIQLSLFSRHEQTVSLGSVEDAGYNQSGVIQMLFNYGSIRLSTEGEETTYLFTYTANPKKQVAVISNAIESFKNGRPVQG